MIHRDCMIGDRVKFRCDIKKGTFDGEVMEVITGDHLKEPTLRIHHLIEDGNDYHIRQSNIEELNGNIYLDPIVATLVRL